MNNRLSTSENFIQLCQERPFYLLKAISSQGPSPLSENSLIKRYTKECLSNVYKKIPELILLPSIILFIATRVIHRNRALALTGSMTLKNILVKYLPGIILYSQFVIPRVAKININHSQEQFKEIEEDLKVFLQKKGNKICAIQSSLL